MGSRAVTPPLGTGLRLMSRSSANPDGTKADGGKKTSYREAAGGGETRQGPSGSAEGRANRGAEWWGRRTGKSTALQLARAEGSLFAHMNFYIDGRTGELTHYELKRLINSQGGTVDIGFGKTTVGYIITADPAGLSGSKNHQLLTKPGGRYSTHVVTPQWIIDSIEAGALLPTSRYSAIPAAPSTQTLPGLLAPKAIRVSATASGSMPPKIKRDRIRPKSSKSKKTQDNSSTLASSSQLPSKVMEALSQPAVGGGAARALLATTSSDAGVDEEKRLRKLEKVSTPAYLIPPKKRMRTSTLTSFVKVEEAEQQDGTRSEPDGWFPIDPDDDPAITGF